MKLKNKKTGEIGELHFKPDKEYHFTVVTEDPADMRIYKTIAELNEEWKDHEGPKEYWFIDTVMIEVAYDALGADSDAEEFNKAIGNYFETKEEAERVVEKLKAWKRLKDKGFSFYRYAQVKDNVFNLYAKSAYDDIEEDLDLLFGGEE